MPESNDNLAPLVRHLIHDPCLPRRGNAFDIRRPAPPRAAKSPVRSRPTPPRPTVLVVGDEAGDAHGLVEILVGAGLEVLRAGDDPRALPQVPVSRADLVLLDVVMPSASGFEMFRRLRGDEALPGTPILFVSAVEDARARLASFAAGASDQVSKPFEPDAILARVHLHLELRQLRHAHGNQDQLHHGAEVPLEQEVAQAILVTALKLTRTEASVLYWVREGKTSPEIAIIVGAALPTVKKHLEHVYEKLGVETRTAAALLASEVLQRRDPL